jgi:hypothetical protein
MASELPDDVHWLHTHFLHTPASVTRYAALIRGLGWSFSAHAKDIWTSPEWELREKLADAAWGVTCTQANLDYLRSLSRDPAKVHLVYHGLDFSRIPDETTPRRRRDGHNPLGRPRSGKEGLCRPDSPRWRHCEPTRLGASNMSAAVRSAASLRQKGRKARHRRAHRLARRPRPRLSFSTLLRAPTVRAPLPPDRIRRPRRPPNVPHGGQAFGVPVLSTDGFRHP